MVLPRKHALPLLLIAALAAIPLLAGGCASSALAAPQKATAERSITVAGRGLVSGKPDLAQASLGVETYAASVGEATQQNSTKMASVMAKLKELGIADKDIQTANFSINLERQGPADTGGQYRVSNMVQVKIRDLDKVGSLLDAAVQAGANQVWGVTFTIEDQKALEAEARAKAVADGKARAEALAKLAGAQLGQVLAVTEAGATMPSPLRMAAMGAGDVAMASVAPISPGEVQVSYQVDVTYAIQ